MNKLVLNIEIQDFIDENLNIDTNNILLKGTAFNGVETKEIIKQIEAKKRSKTKLPTWFKKINIYYPNKLNIEQTSSEITAKFKSNLVSGDSIVDLTGGFGVDCLYFSKVFKNVWYCEFNKELSAIVSHNFQQLLIKNISIHDCDSIEFLKTSTKLYDWIYIDPSRRHNSKGKVFFLNDCFPNVPEQLGVIFKYTENIMIKTSPLLDLSVGINELNYVKSIHVVAVNNDVKELLWILEKGFNGTIAIETINIKKETNQLFKLSIDDEKNSESIYHKPLSYLYEPNNAILKAGAFHSISNQLNVFKLQQHSHLYTSNSLIDFPGRTFKIENIIAYNKKELKRLNILKANITIRNFSETVQKIRKKFNIKEGGDMYLFFTTDIENNKIVIICSKLV